MTLEFNINSLSFIFLIVFLVVFVIQLVYYWGLFSKLAFHKNKKKDEDLGELEPVSVVLCTKNAYENLRKLLPLLLEQEYPNFEIVVVNDSSDVIRESDESEEYLKDMARNDSRVKPVLLRQSLNFFHGKKFPLSMGIKSASHDLLILTDTNCMPTSKLWIREMALSYKKGQEIVLGYSRVKRQKGLLNILMRYDNMQQGMMSLSLALAKRPYTGDGNNLSYRKSLFYNTKGFTSHYNISDGEDALFISQAATKRNTGVCVDAENTIESTTKATFATWMRRKKRQYATGLLHKSNIKGIINIYHISRILFYVSFAALLGLTPAIITPFDSFYYPLALSILFAIRWISQLIITRATCKRLGEKGLVSGVLLLDPLFTILGITTAFASLLSKKNTW